MPGVGLMVRVVGLGSRSTVELIPGGVNSACHPSEVSKMSANMLVYCVGVVNVQDCAQEPRRLLKQHQRSAQSMVPMGGIKQ